MTARRVATELVLLATRVLWVYAACALAVAAFGDGAKLSLAAPAAVVLLSYGLSRGLGRLDLSERGLRLWGSVLSIALLYVVLRGEIAHDTAVWQLGWVVDLVTTPLDTLDGHAGDVAAVVVLSAAWLYGVTRGASRPSFESTLSEVSVGIVVVVVAVIFASPADAPGAVRWLPVPFMLTALFALALTHLQSSETDERSPLVGAWTLWTGGLLALIAGLALLAAMLDLPSLKAAGTVISLAVTGLTAAVFFVLSPFLIAFASTVQLLSGWLSHGDELVRDVTNMQRPSQEQRQHTGPSDWVVALWYALGSSLVLLLAAGVLALLWFSFRRRSARDEDVSEELDLAEAVSGTARAKDGSLLARTLRGLRRPFWGRDPIGRLYVSMLRAAAAHGLQRPASSTPLEFAEPLERHFGSPVVREISQAYSEARYGRRSPEDVQIEELRAAWQLLSRG